MPMKKNPPASSRCSHGHTHSHRQFASLSSNPDPQTAPASAHKDTGRHCPRACLSSSPPTLPPCPENQALPIHAHANVCAHIYTHLYYTHPAHIHCKYTSPHKITWCTHPLDTPGFRLCQALSRHPCKLCACALFSLGSHQCRICTHMRATYMCAQFVHNLHTHEPIGTDTPPFGLH